MWAEVGSHIPTVGPYGFAIAVAVPIVAVLGAISILLVAGSKRIPEGEVRIRILGIKVRWDQRKDQDDKSKDPENTAGKPQALEKRSRLRAVSDRDRQSK